jgi:cation transport regulator
VIDVPYATTSELPPTVRRLPPHAQEIFLEAFNSAWQSYADRGAHDQEEIAFRVAWAAVKKRYRKQGETWVAKGR